MKILLEGAFGESNFGDDLLLLATIEALLTRWPKLEIIINARDTSQDNDYLDRIPGVRFISRKWIHSFRPYDLKLYAGGTQFYSYPKTASDEETSKTSIILNKIFWKISRIWNSSKPNAYLGVGIGPFHDGNEDACKKLLLNASFLSVRDKISVNYLNNWGIHEFESGADICFQSDWWLKKFKKPIARLNKEIIGIVVRDFDHDLPGKDYLTNLCKFIENQKRAGKFIQCFAFSAIKDEKSISYFKSQGIDVAVWCGELQELDMYLEKISSCSILISARYHGVVIGSIFGIPTIGIEVDPKVRLACESLGTGSSNWPPPFQLVELEEMVHRLSKDPASIQRVLEGKTSDLREKTQLMFSKFVDFVERDISHG